MGRGRGKGKKQSAVADHDDTGSGEDEKLPMRRRGRPHKPSKGESDDEENIGLIKKENDDVEETKKSILSSRSQRNQAAAENDRKRKRASHVKENAVTVKEEINGVGAETSATELIKAVGYRPNGRSRKNKPRRAAEAGVECQ